MTSASGGGRRGFTLVELLVVISIILVLAGMLVPAINMVRQAQRKAATGRVLDDLKFAISLYMQDWSYFGGPTNQPLEGSAGDWSSLDPYQPWPPYDYLVYWPQQAIGKPFIDPAKANYDEATRQFLDAFRRPIEIRVTNVRTGNICHTEKVELRSFGSDPGSPDDDITLFYSRVTEQWTAKMDPD